MAAWPGWEDDLLKALGAKPSGAAAGFLDEWHSYEESGATNNPLNTTEPWPRSTVFNTAGVRNYRTRSDGAAATAKTLQNGRYPALLKALDGATLVDDAFILQVAQNLIVWGSSNFAHVYYKQTTGDDLDDALAKAAPVPAAQGGAQPQVQVQQAWNRLHQFLAWGVRDQRQRVNRSQSRIRKAVR